LVLVLRVINEGHDTKNTPINYAGQIFGQQPQCLTDVNKKTKYVKLRQSLPKAIGTRLLV
jgi:hypothetical protein